MTPAGRELVRRAVRVVAEIDEAVFGPDGPGRGQLTDRLRGLTDLRAP